MPSSRRPNDHPGQAKTTYVRKRLLETLEFISKKNLAAHTPGVTRRTIEVALTTDSSTIPWKIATPLDWAWAKYVKGHDLWTLDVPHGSTSTYHSFACRCQPCAAATTLRERHRLAGRPAPGSPLRDTKKRAQVARHLLLLREHATMRYIAKRAGIDHYTVQLAAANPTSGITHRTALALLSVSVDDVQGDPSNRIMVDSAPSLHLVQCLRALGYPMSWLERQIGFNNNLYMMHTREKITATTATRIADLAAHINEHQATPADGIPAHIIRLTKAEAAARGWYPPAAYDDHGNVDPRSIPGHKWALADEWCARQIEAIYQLSCGVPNADAARIAGITPDSLAQRPRHGLTYSTDGKELDYQASGLRLTQIRDVYRRYEATEVGAVTAALELGVARSDYATQWGDHPEVVAWLARPDTTDATPETGSVPAQTAA